jgi:hypothetical protein
MAHDDATGSGTEAGEGLVTLEHPEAQSLLGLLLRDLLRANLADDALRQHIREARGEIEVRAGEMVVTMRIRDGSVTIVDGPSDKPRAGVAGSMSAFLGVALGGGIVKPFVSGAISVRGDPFFLLKMLPLIRAPKAEARGGGRAEGK